MVNCVMVTNGSRPDLLEQAVGSLLDCMDTNLTLVCDGPVVGVERRGRIQKVTLRQPVRILGMLKNIGITVSERTFMRGEWLYVCDDDVYHRPLWYDRLAMAMRQLPEFGVLGGCRHPYHQPNGQHKVTGGKVVEVDAVAGYGHWMRWQVWDRFGPYDSHARGTGQSEDFAFCQKVVEGGMKCGYLGSPSPILHCGLTSSTSGKPVIGSEHMEMATQEEVESGVLQQ